MRQTMISLSISTPSQSKITRSRSERDKGGKPARTKEGRLYRIPSAPPARREAAAEHYGVDAHPPAERRDRLVKPLLPLLVRRREQVRRISLARVDQSVGTDADETVLGAVFHRCVEQGAGGLV